MEDGVGWGVSNHSFIKLARAAVNVLTQLVNDVAEGYVNEEHQR